MDFAAQGVAAVLSRGASHASLQAVRAEVEKGLAQERARAEEYLRGGQQQQQPPAAEAVQTRLEVRARVCVCMCTCDAVASFSFCLVHVLIKLHPPPPI